MTAAIEGEQFASLLTLQERHAALVKELSRESNEQSAGLIKQFVHQCVAAGHVLDCPADRSAVQSLISFWVSRLHRVARLAPSRDASELVVAAEDELDESDETDDTSLAEFQQDAFNAFVIKPTEQWIGGLSTTDQTLVRRIVLRLLNLRTNGMFEAIPNTRMLLESLEPTDRASQLLDKLVRLGVVRRLRHSLEIEEYTLQSLARLNDWHNLRAWMEERRQFRNKAEASIAIQLARADQVRTRLCAMRFDG